MGAQLHVLAHLFPATGTEERVLHWIRDAKGINSSWKGCIPRHGKVRAALAHCLLLEKKATTLRD